jgi:hypothetical protein
MGKKKTEVVGPIRIEKKVMDEIRRVSSIEERTYSKQIGKILKEWVATIKEKT